MYMLWLVFEHGTIARYYIVNRKTKQVQSTWKNYKEASEACNDLNRKDAA